MNNHNDDADDMTLPTPWSEIPILDAPTPTERERALNAYPPEAIPPGDAVPDPSHYTTNPATIEVPEWALEAVAWRLSDHHQPLSRHHVQDIIQRYVHADFTFVTEDGEPLVDVLRDEHDIDIIDDDE